MKNQDESNRRTSPSVSHVPALPEPHPVGTGEVSVSHAERAHSKISPSKLKNLELCPGFRDDPDREVHAITLQGTKCHEALDSGDGSTLTDEERGWVKMCRDYTDSLTTPQAKQHREIRLNILQGIWGFADLFIEHGHGYGDLVGLPLRKNDVVREAPDTGNDFQFWLSHERGALRG